MMINNNYITIILSCLASIYLIFFLVWQYKRFRSLRRIFLILSNCAVSFLIVFLGPQVEYAIWQSIFQDISSQASLVYNIVSDFNVNVTWGIFPGIAIGICSSYATIFSRHYLNICLAAFLSFSLIDILNHTIGSGTDTPLQFSLQCNIIGAMFVGLLLSIYSTIISKTMSLTSSESNFFPAITLKNGIIALSIGLTAYFCLYLIFFLPKPQSIYLSAKNWVSFGLKAKHIPDQYSEFRPYIAIHNPIVGVEHVNKSVYKFKAIQGNVSSLITIYTKQSFTDEASYIKIFDDALVAPNYFVEGNDYQIEIRSCAITNKDKKKVIEYISNSNTYRLLFPFEKPIMISKQNIVTIDNVVYTIHPDSKTNQNELYVKFEGTDSELILESEKPTALLLKSENQIKIQVSAKNLPEPTNISSTKADPADDKNKALHQLAIVVGNSGDKYSLTTNVFSNVINLPIDIVSVVQPHNLPIRLSSFWVKLSDGKLRINNEQYTITTDQVISIDNEAVQLFVEKDLSLRIEGMAKALTLNGITKKTTVWNTISPESRNALIIVFLSAIAPIVFRVLGKLFKTTHSIIE